MSNYEPIECGLYDVLEIVCMDRYEVELQLEDDTLSGVAIGLETRDHQEFLRLRPSTDAEEVVRLDRIQTLTVLSRPARFRFHDFTKSQTANSRNSD